MKETNGKMLNAKQCRKLYKWSTHWASKQWLRGAKDMEDLDQQGKYGSVYNS